MNEALLMKIDGGTAGAEETSSIKSRNLNGNIPFYFNCCS